MVLTEKMLIETGVTITNKFKESIYILSDGTLVSGEFVDGDRTVDHRMIERFCKFTKYDGEKFWEEVMIDLGLIMIIPEYSEILIHPNHIITKEQKRVIDLISDYSIAEFK